MSGLEHNYPVFSFIAIFILGLLFGSFFNVVILRLPAEQSFWGGRSHCMKCGKRIAWYHNLPILSFIWLRGKCAECGEKISHQYWMVELATGLLFVWVYLNTGLTVNFVGYTVFSSLLLVISVIDLHHRIIPDELSLGGMVAGFVFSFLWTETSWVHSLVGILLGGGVFLAVALFYEKVAGREGLGGGDVKLLAMIGAWLGFQSILLVILISSAVGSVVGVVYMIWKKGDLKSAIPFGPFLALGAMICAFFGKGLQYLLYPSIP
ncbi:MAG: prepilin peptidase [Bdellovibrionales bacterium]|nr:prepilin peptidase [Bdellovibrionales bacterium]